MTKQADRRPADVSLRADLVAEARSLGVNLSRACEAGVEAAVKMERERRWKIENAGAIAAYNEWVEQNGVPLAEFRQF